MPPRGKKHPQKALSDALIDGVSPLVTVVNAGNLTFSIVIMAILAWAAATGALHPLAMHSKTVYSPEFHLALQVCMLFCLWSNFDVFVYYSLDVSNKGLYSLHHIIRTVMIGWVWWNEYHAVGTAVCIFLFFVHQASIMVTLLWGIGRHSLLYQNVSYGLYGFNIVSRQLHYTLCTFGVEERPPLLLPLWFAITFMELLALAGLATGYYKFWQSHMRPWIKSWKARSE